MNEEYIRDKSTRMEKKKEKDIMIDPCTIQYV